MTTTRAQKRMREYLIDDLEDFESRISNEHPETDFVSIEATESISETDTANENNVSESNNERTGMRCLFFFRPFY